MIKVNTEKNSEEYLTELYDILAKNIKTDNEYYSIIDIVEKMYSYNINTATKWTFELLNKYAHHGLQSKSNIVIYNFIDTLLILLIRYHHIDEVIILIYQNIKNNNVKFLLWSYLFSPNYQNSLFSKYLDDLIKNNEYDKSYKLISLILNNHEKINKEIFDVFNLLNNIINNYINQKEKIKDQKLLDLLYSFIELIKDERSKAILKSNFIDYI